MSKGTLLALLMAVLTVVFIVIGTLSPVPAAVYYAGGKNLLRESSTPQAAVDNLAVDLKQRAWGNAYNSLANKAEFTESQFVQDMTGSTLSLRTFADLESYDVRPLHASADDAEMALKLRW